MVELPVFCYGEGEDRPTMCPEFMAVWESASRGHYIDKFAGYGGNFVRFYLSLDEENCRKVLDYIANWKG